MSKKTNKQYWHFWFLRIIAILVLFLAAALAGVTASIFTDQSLNRYTQSLRDVDTFLNISQVKPRPLPGTYEEAIETVRSQGIPSLAGLKIQNQLSGADDLFTFDSMDGYGLVLTSDGWLLFHQEVLVSGQSLEAYEIWVGGDAYQPESIAYDSLTNMALVKIDANNLPTLAFGSTQDMDGGELLFMIYGSGAVKPMSLESVMLPDALIVPDYAYINEWILTENTEMYAPILNSAGEFVGFTNGNGQMTPRHYINPFMNTMLAGDELNYASLGLQVVHLSSILNQFSQKGILIDGFLSESIPGLEIGDIIISVDGIDILDGDVFGEILKEYDPGDMIELEIMRDQEVVIEEIEVISNS